jgi:protein-S-isoprenylcysteine O-methyltransferase
MIAMSASYVELLVEYIRYGRVKTEFYKLLICVFLPLSLVGILTRIAAFSSARSNFHHLIRYDKDPKHVLVRTGIYAFERHPGYLGYFVFSISSQLMVKNYFSAVAFTFVLWRFFLRRIIDEEITLLVFFKEDYLEYKREVGTYIPMIAKLVDLKLELKGIISKKDN